jgi:hypothetical protein
MWVTRESNSRFTGLSRSQTGFAGKSTPLLFYHHDRVFSSNCWAPSTTRLAAADGALRMARCAVERKNGASREFCVQEAAG